MPTRKRNKKANPFMASSTLSVRQFEKMLDYFIMIQNVRGISRGAGVSVKTADNFVKLLMERMQLAGFLDVVPALLETLDQDRLEKLFQWVEYYLSWHRGFPDLEIESMHRVRYIWLSLMVHIHKPLLTNYEGKVGLHLAVKAIRRLLIDLVKITGPLNRNPLEINLTRAREKYYRDLFRKLENRKFA